MQLSAGSTANTPQTAVLSFFTLIVHWKSGIDRNKHITRHPVPFLPLHNFLEYDNSDSDILKAIAAQQLKNCLYQKKRHNYNAYKIEC